MHYIDTDTAPAAIGPYSQAVSESGWVFTSGQIALDPETNEVVGTTVEEQTRQALLNLENVLLASGSRISKVVKTTVYLKNMDDFAAMNEAYASIFEGFNPARSTVEVSRLPKDVLVEIDCVAVLGHGS